MGRKTYNERRIGRRNMIAGILVGAVLATVAGAYAKTVFKKMVNNTVATAADVNTAHQDLADAIDKVELDLVQFKSSTDCPPGYTRDATATTITLCKSTNGSDEMVKVGRFWVDRYESVLVDSKTYNGGTCDGAGGKCGASATGQCGAGIVDDYPSTFPDSGNWTSPVYACSKKGAVPSRMMTWFQAQQACLLSNKRLCTIGEWQGASAGTYDAGKYNGAAGGACHTGGTALRKTGLAGKTPGASSSCISLWGAEDMNGNLQEYADRWGQAGTHWATSDVHFATPWSAAKGYGEGGDRTWNVNGRASNGASWVAGAPAVAILGGYFMSGAAAGAVALNMNSSPSGWHLANGSRCCRD